MGTLQFILVTLAVVVGIVWAIDIPTTKWYGFTKPKTPSLLTILQRINGIPETPQTEDTNAPTSHNKRPARTYAEAKNRMQEREKARLERSSSGNDPL